MLDAELCMVALPIDLLWHIIVPCALRVDASFARHEDVFRLELVHDLSVDDGPSRLLKRFDLLSLSLPWGDNRFIRECRANVVRLVTLSTLDPVERLLHLGI